MDNVVSKLNMAKMPGKTSRTPLKKSPWLAVLKWFIIIIALLVVLFFATSPLRGKSAEHFVASGDNLLSEKKYMSADLEYQKALVLNPNNQLAKERRELINKSQKDVYELNRFYEETKNLDALVSMEDAKSFPANEYEAVKKSKTLIEEGQYQLAITPAKTAMEMDRVYRDAWLYLGIANLKTAQLVELTPEARKQYIDSAKEALNQAFNLDPEYKISKQFLSEVEKLPAS